MFSGLLKPSSSSPKPPRRRSRASQSLSTPTSSSDQSSPEPGPAKEPPAERYIRVESQLPPRPPEDPDLRELNNSLGALAAIFPDVQVEVFREMLSSFDEESRLAVVTEMLLKHKMKWVRGRYRVSGKDKALAKPDTAPGTDTAAHADADSLVPPEERFRSAEYKKAVKTIAYHEFKGLSRSTINAVLAEFNHSYTLARPTLVSLSSKSWRFTISSLFMRRKTMSSSDAEQHPLVIWQSFGQGCIVPTLKTTGSPELDTELFDTLIRPLTQRALCEREEKDHALALELNNIEAEDNEALHDCECCFTSTTFEDLTACDGGHLICFQCVRHAVNEAVFGQGWQRNIDLKAGTLRCVAAMSDACPGCVPPELVRRAFDEEKSGKDVIQKLDERLAEDNLLKTQLPLIRCPFCSYAEVDELYLPEPQRSWRLKRVVPSSLYTFVILILGVGMIPFLLPSFVIFSFLFLLVSSRQTFGDFAMGYFNAAVIRLRRKRLGLKFVCQSKECGRASCISCSKAWTDIHICHESSLLALRTQVELAMSLAIKRTCPRCNTSFVKSSGCNKLTCVCGYQMCYVCRKDIGNGEGYRHFCEHFRPNGGRGCTECSKCDLYRCEDDEVVVKKAKEDAERLWMDKEGQNLGSDDKVRKVLEEKWISGKEGAWWEMEWHMRMPKWESVFDGFVERLVE
ncbi:RING finger protein (Zin) [Drepanopeziza brunnea f. sp. 'multigermtubi' MB_m1]|uniref:RING finger protein (Zin) n=1 Tax=Marssonina brunnea f. sp. multigermtubi (strain MB_m1) TaxID=1072389 RepID=K1Y3N2_MARBU|nr:RING finger protein (Zin) [Drepanopeziza brunnea f. sp. 'multigermtubi' MB_m1]EKD19789.1 RING finger protein (Zin) [Drepanopeziza brunnea f. sp. 'multigermtubi' MB_m1]